MNCETDFVGRKEELKELFDDLAVQVVACPQVQFVSIEDTSEISKNGREIYGIQKDWKFRLYDGKN